jgi:hypothetical protein
VAKPNKNPPATERKQTTARPDALGYVPGASMSPVLRGNLCRAAVLVSLAFAASCGRSDLYGDFVESAGGDGFESGGNGNGSGGTRAGRAGSNGSGGDGVATGGSGPNTGGSDGTGGVLISGGTGPDAGGAVSTGGTASGGDSTSGGSDTGGFAGAAASGGVPSGGVSGVGGDAGQSGNAGKAGMAGMAGQTNMPGVNCGGTVCDAADTCCVGLTATACLPAGTACNGAVLLCSAPSECEDASFCCLTMGGGMASSECSNECSNSFDGNGRLKLRLCESDDDCTPNRECRMTFVGVMACMRRFD